jgi:hypothetical protein
MGSIYGGSGGEPVGPWPLEADETLVAVEQMNPAAGHLGSNIVFQTSKGRYIAFLNRSSSRLQPLSHKVWRPPAVAEIICISTCLFSAETMHESQAAETRRESQAVDTRRENIGQDVCQHEATTLSKRC